METIIVKPSNKKEFNFLKEFFKKTNTSVEYREEKTETLEDKIIRLYREKHYTEEDVEWFFSIPKKYRIDPFEMIDDGDIYWADQRNINQLKRDFDQAEKDKAEGRTITFNSVEELDNYIQSL